MSYVSIVITSIILLILILWSYPPSTSTVPANMCDRSLTYKQIKYGRFETVHAITIDGGGVKVLFSIGVLIKELEEIFNKRCTDPLEHITMFAGTSSGSVLAAILANREMMLPRFVNMNKDIALKILRSIEPIPTSDVNVRRFVYPNVVMGPPLDMRTIASCIQTINDHLRMVSHVGISIHETLVYNFERYTNKSEAVGVYQNIYNSMNLVNMYIGNQQFRIDCINDRHVVNGFKSDGVKMGGNQVLELYRKTMSCIEQIAGIVNTYMILVELLQTLQTDGGTSSQHMTIMATLIRLFPQTDFDVDVDVFRTSSMFDSIIYRFSIELYDVYSIYSDVKSQLLTHVWIHPLTICLLDDYDIIRMINNLDEKAQYMIRHSVESEYGKTALISKIFDGGHSSCIIYQQILAALPANVIYSKNIRNKKVTNMDDMSLINIMADIYDTQNALLVEQCLNIRGMTTSIYLLYLVREHFKSTVIPELFNPSGFSWDVRVLYGLFGSRYESLQRRKLLQSLFGDLNMDSCFKFYERQLMIPVINSNTRTIPITSTVTTPATLLADILFASTAAPTYFHPVCGYIDAGILVNDTTVLVMNTMISYMDRPCGMHIINIGTGSYVKTSQSDDSISALKMATKLIHLSIQTSAGYIKESSGYFMEPFQISTFDIALEPDIGIADASEETLTRLYNIVDTYKPTSRFLNNVENRIEFEFLNTLQSLASVKNNVMQYIIDVFTTTSDSVVYMHGPMVRTAC